MDARRFYIVDVFAQEKYAGNQLAVVRDCADLSTDEMLRIAQEMNYSETTFILSDEERDGGYDVRIFTLAEEVPFAGHPTLGTAYIIQRELIKRPMDRITLNLKIGSIPVTWEREILWMRQKAPDFGQIYDAAAIADVLGLDLAALDDRFPIQDVSTGLPFIICPLRSGEVLRSIRVDREKLLYLASKGRAKAVLAFCPEPRNQENDLAVRVFTHYYGIPEDPATGSANGCLAAYLARHRYFDEASIDVRVEQGSEIGRPSLLYLRAEDGAEQFEVTVGGQVVMVAAGTLV